MELNVNASYTAAEDEVSCCHVEMCVQIEFLKEEICHLVLEHVIPFQQLTYTLHHKLSSASDAPYYVNMGFCAGYQCCV